MFVSIYIILYYIILCYIYNTCTSNYCFMLAGTQRIMLNTVFESTK